MGLLGAALAAAPVSLRAQQDTTRLLKDKIEQSQKRLEEIRQQRQQLRQAMQRLTHQVSTASEEIGNLEKQIGSSSSVVAELDVQIEASGEQVARTTARMLQTRDELTVRKTELHERLKEVYERGPLGPLQVLLSARSFSDLIDRYKYLHLVTLYDRMLVRQVGTLEGKLEEQRSELAGQLSRLQDLRGSKKQELSDLQSLRLQYRRRLSLYRTQRSKAREQEAQLAQDEAQLQNVIAELERARRESERRAGRSTSSSLTTGDLGKLAWPVDGRIIYQFGPERNGGTTINRDGIGIAASEGTPVKAVESGRVEFAGTQGLMGPTVIVSHGGGYYSAYLYLERVRVHVGERVARGQVIGAVGGASSRSGPHIEFQIHQPTAGGAPQPVDPVRWLRSHSGG
ncbi:MAG: peptidoglycan DD-metalloendopeptidase family protein [Candidatus Palauibacterales bacterium]|nr:peptidoglycan DD-metalloendopeptidase family protein [Candidatus Palauibacterales bacterium]